MPSEPTTPLFKVYNSTQSFINQNVLFQITTFENSAFIWVGVAENEVLGNLAVAMPPISSRNNNNIIKASATTILAKDITETSKQFGQKLATKFKKQFFVSFNLPSNADQMMVSFAEKKIISMINEIWVP
ncbi:10619_t:CDS:2 [Diversispora eburnea]|uniref:10619_t:CDS:1 n=1 Tax=Diversispora eburnea TaxID=1213867 RepID=A0A9N8W807_9GLOM|nr:10619_t:CDS:2 [Diversispora eburnea]